MICVPLNSKSFARLLADLTRAQKIGDVVEFWFENFPFLTSEQIAQLFKKKTKPFLFKFQGNFDLLSKFQGRTLEYIDVDLHTSSKLLKEIRNLFPHSALIISHHDFTSTPKEKMLRAILLKMTKLGADIKKIATTAHSLADSLLLLSLAKEYSEKDEKVILIGMGKQGIITRTAGHLCGNYLMYCPLSEKQKTAPGQITAIELKKIMDLTS